MTELQIGLIGLSLTVVAGVYAYNKWQEYRHRKVAESVLRPHPDDVLLDPVRRAPAEPVAEPARPAVERVEPMFVRDEPVFVEPPAVAEPVFVNPPAQPDDLPPPWEAPVVVEEITLAPVVDAREPDLDIAAEPEPEPEPEPVVAVPAPPVAAVEAPPEQPAGPLPEALLDPRIEFIVAMELVEPVSSHQILNSQRDVLQRLAKPVHWIGFNERTREWVRLRGDHDVAVRSLRVGLQLVNRLGPVADGDLALFTGAMQGLADELMAVADMPSTRVLDQAAEIDRFCAAVDLEIGLNLVSRGNAFPGTKIRALAEAAGMVLGLDGMFTRYDDDGRPQFSLQNYESTPFTAEGLRTLTTHGLTFLLDVPRVDHGERVFMQMTEQARRFAETLQGALVDDNRQPLGDSQLEHIRREFIGKPQATMLSFGMPAGSPQALRLFS